MGLTSVAILVGMLFMGKVSESINVVPGKQLPQSLTVHLDEKPAARDVTIRYMLFVPIDYKKSGKKWPLMLFLHGLGECSKDDLSRVKIHGPAHFVDSRPDFPFVVVTPQIPPPPGYKEGIAYSSEQIIALAHDAWKPEPLIRLLDQLIAKLNIDPDRVYVTGLSMGGYGTYRLVAAHPDRFAAAVAICGGGEPEMAKSLARVPIWAFHGAKDTTVPLPIGQKMVDEIKQAGGDVRWTVYPDVGHDSWKPAYAHDKVYSWLLAHKRKKL